jgi:hypothetical protein
MIGDVGHYQISGSALARDDLHRMLGHDAAACLEQKFTKALNQSLRVNGIAVAGHQHAAPHAGRNAREHLPQVFGPENLAWNVLTLPELPLERGGRRLRLALPDMHLSDLADEIVEALLTEQLLPTIESVAVKRAVCTENLSSGVVVVKSAKDGV